MKRLLLALLLAPAVLAAPLTRDLGEGLAYVRVRSVPADLPAPSASPAALVLDLRYARATDAASAGVLSAFLNFRPAGAPLLVLVNADTAPALLAALSARPVPAGLVTLGSPVGAYTPDLVLKIPPEAERLAYDALAQGVPVARLLVENPGKPRNDEAALVAAPKAAPHEPVPDDPGPPDLAGAGSEPAPHDLVLARAVHLHRALRALRRG